MKTKLEDIGTLAPSKSEWAGFYLQDGETVMLKPKSFKDFDEAQLNFAFTGLFHILNQIKKEDKNIKLLHDEVVLKRVQNESMLFYYLYLVLEELYDDVVSSSYFFYERKIENTSSIKGRINFSKSLTKNFGLDHKKVCEFNHISFQHPILSLIREYFVYFSNQLSKISHICSDINEKLTPIVSHVVHVFSEVNYLNNNLEETIRLVSGHHDQDHRFLNIITNMKILGQFYLDNHLYFSNEKEQTNFKMHGLVFNLNRPFEHIVRVSCEKLLQPALSISSKDFTKVRYNKIARSFQMKPDIWFEYENNTIILDVKHKVHSGDIDLEDDKKEKLDRNDLYQLISYMTTHRNASKAVERSENNIYGIISLIEEDNSFNSYNYINFNANQVLEVDNIDEKIIIAPIRLGTFLVDLGSSITNKNSYYLNEEGLSYEMDGLYEELGKQLNSIFKFKIDSEFKMIEHFKERVFQKFDDDRFSTCISLREVLKKLDFGDVFVAPNMVESFLGKLEVAMGAGYTEHYELQDLKDKILLDYRINSKAS